LFISQTKDEWNGNQEWFRDKHTVLAMKEQGYENSSQILVKETTTLTIVPHLSNPQCEGKGFLRVFVEKSPDPPSE